MKTLKALKPKLVSNWRDAYKWMSMWFAMAIAVWPLMPEAEQAAIVSGIASFLGVEISVPTALAVLLMVTRLIDQSGKQKTS
jgi:hypothetical protein